MADNTTNQEVMAILQRAIAQGASPQAIAQIYSGQGKIFNPAQPDVNNPTAATPRPGVGQPQGQGSPQGGQGYGSSNGQDPLANPLINPAAIGALVGGTMTNNAGVGALAGAAYSGLGQLYNYFKNKYVSPQQTQQLNSQLSQADLSGLNSNTNPFIITN